MKKLLLALLLVAPLSITAHNIGQTHMDWNHTGLDVNGHPTDLLNFTVSCGPASGQYSTIYNIPDGNARHVTTAELNLADGVWYCQTTASNYIGESGPSDEIRFRLAGGLPITEGVPAAPGNLVLTAD